MRALGRGLFLLAVTLFFTAASRAVGQAGLDELIGQAYALVYKKQYDEALVPAERYAEGKKTVLGENSTGYAAVLTEVARIYTLANRLSEAETRYQRALEIREQVLGKEHPDTIRSLDALASFYLTHDRIGEGEPLMRRALIMSARVVEDNAQTGMEIDFLCGLAQIYVRDGEFAKAEAEAKFVLEEGDRLFGAGHIQMLFCRTFLASSYAGKMHYAEAETLLMRNVDALKTVSKKDDERIINQLNGLVSVYRLWGRSADAEAIRVQIQDMQNRKEHEDKISQGTP